MAVKLLPPAFAQDAEAVQRFHREVKAAAKLMHPNIVAAFDAGEAHGQHYLVMEYIEGADLASVVARQGPLPVSLGVHFVRQAASG